MLEENNNNNFETNYFESEAPQANIPVAPYFPYQNLSDPEELAEKRTLRRKGLAIGLSSIGLSVIGFVWSFIYFFITIKFLGISTEKSWEIVEDPAVQQVLQIILSCLMFLLPFTIAAKCLKKKIGQLVMFGKAKKGTFLPLLLFGIGFCSFSNIAMNYISSIFNYFGGEHIEYKVDFGENPEGFFGFLLSFIATAIVPALVEEFACRGIVLGLLKKHGEGFAIISSSIIFGVMHGNFEQIPFAVMVGLILGYIYVKTGSIWTCVAVHFANNAISVIFTYLQGIISVNIQNVLYVVYLIVSMLLAIEGIWLFAKNTDENYALEKAEGKITAKQRYIWFFTSWAIIVFLSINILEALSFFSLT